MFVFKYPRNSPLQDLVEINTEHPAYRAINSLFVATAGGVVDVSDRFSKPVGGVFPIAALSTGGRSLLFNGTTNYIRMPNAALCNGTKFSKFAIIQPNSFAGTSTISSTAGLYGAQLRLDATNLSFVYSGIVELFSQPHGLVAGRIACVGVTYDGTTLEGFVNGRLVASVACSYSFVQDGIESSLGQRGKGSEYFNGHILANIEYSSSIGKPLAISLTSNPWQVFAPQSRSLWVPSSVTGIVNLQLPLIGSTTTVYTPSITVGRVDLITPLVSTTVVYSPSVVTTISLTAPLIATTVVYTPSITVGRVDLTTPLVSTTVVYPPSVVATISLTAPLITSTTSVYAPQLTLGKVNLTTPLIATTVVYTPQLTLGKVNLTTPLITTTVVYAPQLTLGKVNLTTPLVNTTVVYAPQLTLGKVNLTTPLIATTVVYAPQLPLSIVNLVAPLIDSTSVLYTFNVSNATPYTISLRYYTSANRSHVLSTSSKDHKLVSGARNTVLSSTIRNIVLNTIAKITLFFSPKRDN